MKLSDLNENLFDTIKSKAKEIWNGCDIKSLTDGEIKEKADIMIDEIKAYISKSGNFKHVRPFIEKTEESGDTLVPEDIAKVKNKALDALGQFKTFVLNKQPDLVCYKIEFLASKIFYDAIDRTFKKPEGYDSWIIDDSPFDKFLYKIGKKIF